MNQDEIDKAMRERYERKEAEEAERREARAKATIAQREREREAARIDDFKPTQFAPGLFTFLIAALPCVHCSRPTVPDLESNSCSAGPFPRAWSRNFANQRERAGIQQLAHWRDINEPVCVGCKNAGTETFECSHCGKTRPFVASHSSYGSPAEHLCVPCYETVPAKQWEGLVAELEEQHRYDFE